MLFKHIELEETVVNDTPVVKRTEKETAFLIGSPAKADDENGSRYFAYGGGSVIYVIEENDLPQLFDLIEID